MIVRLVIPSVRYTGSVPKFISDIRMYGELQSDDTIATVSRGESLGVTARLIVRCVVPYVLNTSFIRNGVCDLRFDVDMQNHHTVTLVRRFLSQCDGEIASGIEDLVNIISFIVSVLTDGIIKMLWCVSGVDGDRECTFLTFAGSLGIVAADFEGRGGRYGSVVVGALRQQVVIVVVPAIECAAAIGDVGGKIGGEGTAVGNRGELRHGRNSVHGGYNGFAGTLTGGVLVVALYVVRSSVGADGSGESETGVLWHGLCRIVEIP